MRVLIAMPTSRHIEVETSASLIGMHKVGEIGVYMPVGYSVDVSRNLIVEHAISNNYDYIFWVDTDMIVPKDALIKMLSSGKDIISGVYSYKLLNGTNAVAKINKNGTYKDIPLKKIRETNKIMEVDGIGFGCVLTKTSVFNALRKPYFKFTEVCGEDIYFCIKAQEKGYKVYLDTSIKCGHIGSVNYNI